MRLNLLDLALDHPGLLRRLGLDPSLPKALTRLTRPPSPTVSPSPSPSRTAPGRDAGPGRTRREGRHQGAPGGRGREGRAVVGRHRPSQAITGHHRPSQAITGHHRPPQATGGAGFRPTFPAGPAWALKRGVPRIPFPASSQGCVPRCPWWRTPPALLATRPGRKPPTMSEAPRPKEAPRPTEAACPPEARGRRRPLARRMPSVRRKPTARRRAGVVGAAGSSSSAAASPGCSPRPRSGTTSVPWRSSRPTSCRRGPARGPVSRRPPTSTSCTRAEPRPSRASCPAPCSVSWRRAPTGSR